MHRMCRYILLIFTPLFFVACGGAKPTLHVAGDSVYRDVYRISPQDQIELIVFQRSELSGSYLVGPDGTIGIPLAGAVKIAGLTREEAEEQIVLALSEFYNPITVLLKLPRIQENEYFLVIGEVMSPGSYPIKGQISLLKAIGAAGGFTEDAAVGRMKLIRNKENAGGVYVIDMADFINDADYSQNYVVRHDDIIYVPRQRFSTVLVYLNKITPFISAIALAAVLVNSINRP